MKAVINGCIGGFSISIKCAERMAELGNKEAQEIMEDYHHRAETLEDDIDNECGVHWYGYLWDTPRHDTALVRAVEELGEESWGDSAELRIIELPDNLEYYIDDGECGVETLHEKHRIWYYNNEIGKGDSYESK